MQDRQIILYVLLAVLTLTTVASLAANLELVGIGETAKSFARWSLAAVLVEVIGLTVFAVRTSLRETNYLVSIVLPDPTFDILASRWPAADCYLLAGDKRFAITPAVSQHGPALEVAIPNKVLSDDHGESPIEIFLQDDQKNTVVCPRFFLYRHYLTAKLRRGQGTLVEEI
jgi:hypothetical protein